MERRGRAALLAALILSALVPAAAPVAQATPNPIDADIASPQTGAQFARGETILFVDGTTTSESCPIVRWTWRFGDGHDAEGEQAEHAYAALGSYDVTLQAEGSCGRRQSHGITLHVVAFPPGARLAVDVPADGGPVTLDANGSADRDGQIVEYRFSLDGAPLAAQAEPTLRVEGLAEGEHEAEVVVVDDEGHLSEPARASFTVAAGPSPSGTAGPLAAIVITGPSAVEAGSKTPYALRGEDADGNEVALLQDSLDFVAPTAAGPATVRYEEQGVAGELVVEVVAAPLAVIALDGPSRLAAGEAARFNLSGADAYGNARALAQPTLDYVAPTAVGPARACYQESGVEGCADVDVVAGPLARILVAGPDAVARGESAAFTLSGEDAYANPVPLANESLAWVAPDEAGIARVCHLEQGVEGCLDVLVVSARVARLELQPATMRANVGRPVALTAVAYDADGQVVPDAPFGWQASPHGRFTAEGAVTSDRIGEVAVTLLSMGVETSAQVMFTNLLDVALDVRAEKPVMDTLHEHGVEGSVVARYTDGTPVAGARVTVIVTRVMPAGPPPPPERVHAVTDGDGVARFRASIPSGLPGDYRVDAHAAAGLLVGTDSRTHRVGF